LVAIEKDSFNCYFEEDDSLTIFSMRLSGMNHMMATATKMANEIPVCQYAAAHANA
jgi:hypothetical protein